MAPSSLDSLIGHLFFLLIYGDTFTTLIGNACLSTTDQIFSRLDLTFASPALLQWVVSAEILSMGISNHDLL